MSLNTGWRQWDTYLKKFVDKEINCLEIGSYKGDATEKMLVHLPLQIVKRDGLLAYNPLPSKQLMLEMNPITEQSMVFYLTTS